METQEDRHMKTEVQSDASIIPVIPGISGMRQKLERGKEVILQGFQREHDPSKTLISDF